MKNQRDDAKHSAGLTLSLIALMAVATLLLSPAKLASAQTVYPNWSITGDLNTARAVHTATLLPDGKVLVAGGHDVHNRVMITELYDPAAGTWSYTGHLNTARFFHTATLLPGGKVLVAGGRGNGN